MNIFFFGSDNFSLFAIKALLQIKNKKKIFIYTTNTHFLENPVIRFSEQNNLDVFPLFTKEKEENNKSFEKISSLIQSEFPNEINVNLTCSFKLMHPSFFIDRFDYNYVVHPSLLPKYRGSSPINATLLNGDKITGVSIVGMSKNKFDAGEIYLQKEIEIAADWRYPDLYSELGNLSAECVTEFFENFDHWKKNGKEQTVLDPGISRKLKSGANLVSFQLDNLRTLENKFKSYFGSSLKTIQFLMNDKIFIAKELSFHHKTLNEIFGISDIYLDQFFDEGRCLDGLFNFKKSFFIKALDGWVEVKEGNFSYKNNLNFSQTKNLLFNAIIKKNIQMTLKDMKNNKKVSIEEFILEINKLKKFN